MADGGVVEAALITAAVGAATTAYSVNASRKAAEEAKAPTLPAAPKPADTSTFATSQQLAQRQAETAGGTILSDQRQNRIGNDPNAVRKTLIGS